MNKLHITIDNYMRRQLKDYIDRLYMIRINISENYVNGLYITD